MPTPARANKNAADCPIIIPIRVKIPEAPEKIASDFVSPILSVNGPSNSLERVNIKKNAESNPEEAFVFHL
ncbi:hypothetical protein SDC9_160442 [bioreactor metagenome]|uniref:Uncharacterized protein n=1 Tax=bioreactor metagenome TaxID=1076179 RepID=A0A645FHX2_9ZZZZ